MVGVIQEHVGPRVNWWIASTGLEVARVGDRISEQESCGRVDRCVGKLKRTCEGKMTHGALSQTVTVMAGCRTNV